MERQQTTPGKGAQERQEIDLLELFSLYLAKLPILIIAFVIGALVAGLYTHYRITPMYQSSAKLYMVSASSGSVVDWTDLSIGTTLSKDYEELMTIRPIYEDIVEELDLDCSYRQLQGMASIARIDETRVMRITATSADPELARDLANAVAQKAIEYLPDVMETSSKPHVAESAILPTAPSSPNLTRNTLYGALAGLAIALALVTLLYLADDTLKNAEDVEKIFGIMPLTVIPESAAVRRSIKPGREDAGRRKRRKKRARQEGSE
jgi:capsular polysaccharide biosynthesis protein